MTPFQINFEKMTEVPENFGPQGTETVDVLDVVRQDKNIGKWWWWKLINIAAADHADDDGDQYYPKCVDDDHHYNHDMKSLNTRTKVNKEKPI